MKELSMQVVNPRSAGIDVGSRFHMVTVDQDQKNIRQFGVYHQGHATLIECLRERKIQTANDPVFENIFKRKTGSGA